MVRESSSFFILQRYRRGWEEGEWEDYEGMLGTACCFLPGGRWGVKGAGKVPQAGLGSHSPSEGT